MIRLSHTLVERLRGDPAGVLAKEPGLLKPGEIKRKHPSRKQFLKWAIRGHYHKKGLQAAMEYMEAAFDEHKFKKSGLEEYSEFLTTYHGHLPPSTFVKHGDRMTYSLLPGQVAMTGEVDRIDLTDAGYSVWLFDVEEKDGWASELRMPLIQRYYAEELGSPFAEVSVGVYSFRSGEYESCSFDLSEIDKAEKEIAKVARAIVAASQ
jgi:hypothetical protein